VSFFYRAMLDVRRLETEKQMKSLELLVLRSKIIICCTVICHHYQLKKGKSTT
jgi:hypothetical protein